MTHTLIEQHTEKLIISSVGSYWTRLYDTVRLGSSTNCDQSTHFRDDSSSITVSQYYDIGQQDDLVAYRSYL